MTLSSTRRALTIIVTDLYLPAELRESLAASTGPRMALPAFEQLLARASKSEAGEWRALAAARAQVAGGSRIPVAAVSMAAQAPAPDAEAQWWVATPVHLQAAHDHVQLAEVVALDPDEWSQLSSGFDREFGAELGPLQGERGAERYCVARRPIDSTTVDPARILGRDVHDSLPMGPGGSGLRRLMTELQMWLHGHSFNAERERRGLLAANGLWLWGGGVMPVVQGSAMLPHLFSDDRFLRGLWALQGANAHALPADARQLLESMQADALVSIALGEVPGENWAQRLAACERDWLAPALAALRSGRLATLELHANDALRTLRARDLWRLWRRPRPWLEAFA